MDKIIPTVGRIVYYKLSTQDAEEINKRRSDYAQNDKSVWPMGAQAHVGNHVEAGEIVPMIVVAVWENELVNGHVFLDGSDTLWVTSRPKGEEPGNWDWMPFQKDQQARLAKEDEEEAAG